MSEVRGVGPYTLQHVLGKGQTGNAMNHFCLFTKTS